MARVTADFTQPFISDVNYPETKIARAVYDPAKDALIVTFERAAAMLFALRARKPDAAASSATWTINNLAPGRDYAIYREERQVGRIRNGAITGAAGAQEHFVFGEGGQGIRTCSS